MIPAPPGLVARFRHGIHTECIERTIVAFDDDGHPFVIDELGQRDKTRLVRADADADYDGMAEFDDPSSTTALLPAGGWRVEYTDSNGTWSEPLVGWGLKGSGEVVPLVTDSVGNVDDLSDEEHLGRYRIYHPDATPSTPS